MSNPNIPAARRNYALRLTPDIAPSDSSMEAWTQQLGVKFISILFYDGKRWFDERHVHDPTTLHDTIKMSIDRHSRYALWHDGEMWCLLSKRTGDTRRLPNREAAEMLAIHGA